MNNPVTDAEREIVARQLGRPPRALVSVAHRCPCGQPDVVETAPRLEDGTPFPTLYYLPCPRATAAASRLEADGRMREWQGDLAADPGLAEGYRRAHEAYLRERGGRGRPTRSWPRAPAAPTSPTSPNATLEACCPPAPPPAGCPTASSACTPWPGT